TKGLGDPLRVPHFAALASAAYRTCFLSAPITMLAGKSPSRYLYCSEFICLYSVASRTLRVSLLSNFSNYSLLLRRAPDCYRKEHRRKPVYNCPNVILQTSL